jgi:hypothetical protein
MKIKEIISEAPAGDIGHAVGHTTNAAAKGIGAVAGAVAGAPKRVAKGIKSGAAAFDKLMSPSQWFGGNDDEPSNFEKDTAKNDKADAAAYKATVTSVSRGMTPNAQDISNLKQLAAGSKTPEEQAVLKAAYLGLRLNPEQVAIIKQVAARL